MTIYDYYDLPPTTYDDYYLILLHITSTVAKSLRRHCQRIVKPLLSYAHDMAKALQSHCQAVFKTWPRKVREIAKRSLA